MGSTAARLTAQAHGAGIRLPPNRLSIFEAMTKRREQSRAERCIGVVRVQKMAPSLFPW
jgi:Fe2+ or Zn2+ uptake regulation protein